MVINPYDKSTIFTHITINTQGDNIYKTQLSHNNQSNQIPTNSSQNISIIITNTHTITQHLQLIS